MERRLYNVALERAVFRQMFPDEYGRFRHVMLSTLAPDAFYYGPVATAHAYYRNHLERTHGEPDYVTLLSDPRLTDPQVEVLRSLKINRDAAYALGSEKEAEAACQQLNNLAYMRRIAQSLHDMDAMLHDPDKSDEEICSAYAQMSEIASQQTAGDDDKIYTIGENTGELQDWLLDPDREPEYYPIGMDSYDSEMGGLPKSGLVLLGAVTSGGKSAFANALLANWVRSLGLRVLKYSLELPPKQEYSRFMAHLAHVSLRNMKSGSLLTTAERDRILRAEKDWKAACEISGGTLDFKCPPSLDFASSIRRVQHRDYDAILYDYVGLMEGADSDQQALSLSRITRQMKSWTQKTGKLVIALVQIDSESNRIRYSRAMQEHADNVIIWYPDENEKKSGDFNMHQTKGRDFGLWSWGVHADWEFMTFSDAGGSFGTSEGDVDTDENGDISLPRSGRQQNAERKQSRRRADAEETASA